MSNEITSISWFLSRYTGVWNPSEEFWLGLDFRFEGEVYRFHTGAMYDATTTILPDGCEACFGVYKKVDDRYELIGEYATPAEALEQCIIDGKSFKEIIVDPSTELLGQD